MSGATVADVLAGDALFAAEEADCIGWLDGLPDDSIDLLLTSPPYEKARLYAEVQFSLAGQAWVDWMVRVVAAAAPKVRGLIAVVCDGQTRDYRYSCTPYLLMADLHRAGFNLRRPVVFHRIGICGSGGPDWLRGDTEPVICITRPGKLPWSDNTACGHPPKWAPGGEFSHRLSDGARVNQWGGHEKSSATRKRDGTRQAPGRPSHEFATVAEKKQRVPGPGGTDVMREQHYTPPVLANPGNVVQERYTADEVASLLAVAGDATHHLVGGGLMGHPLAHENEAPFPVSLAEFFVQSFCPPGGVVADCFLGSGTTIDAALQHGRRGIGCDVRGSQIDIVRRRLSTVTPSLFGKES